MREVIVNEFLSIDGGGPGTRRRRRGHERQLLSSVLESINDAGAFLLGRRAYETFAGYWPNAPEDAQVIAEPMNAKPKYVASTTLSDPLEWQNSTVLERESPRLWPA